MLHRVDTNGRRQLIRRMAERLKVLRKSRGLSVNKLIEEMSAQAIAA